jgi:hypothetical protein
MFLTYQNLRKAKSASAEATSIIGEKTDGYEDLSGGLLLKHKD